MKSLYPNLDLSSLEFKQNAYKIYKELREHDPVHEITMPNGQRTWLITRYNDAVNVLKDNERFTKRVHYFNPDQYASLLPEKEMNLVSRHMLYTDKPDHTRLRSIASNAFTPRMINGMSKEIQELTNELLDPIEERGSMEVVNDFAFMLPAAVISRILGIPQEDYSLIRKWSDDYMTASQNFGNLKSIYQSLNEFRLYIDELVASRKKNPKSDLTSLLVQAHVNGDRLNSEELASTIFVLIVAGHETTGSLISSGLFALLQNPDQMRLWKDDPTVASTAIDELVRYYSPLEFATSRVALQDFTWYDKNIERGDVMFVGIASANRDTEIFEDPDYLDITRKKNKHIGFGNGIHFCLGAPLARLEGDIAITTILKRFPNLRVEGTLEELKWKTGVVVSRGLEQLPVRL
ncbi:cytochrome P450 family protein [Bacillus sp. 1P02SD]|uniref:cytochrome P450 family protein n=1 Tax=Bacillus sp. 1P02SD TaxID=3132264 RepID=UPI00399F2067